MGQIKAEKNVGSIEGLCVIEPAVHGDARGYFMGTYGKWYSVTLSAENKKQFLIPEGFAYGFLASE